MFESAKHDGARETGPRFIGAGMLNPVLLHAMNKMEWCDDCMNTGYLVISAGNHLELVEGKRPLRDDKRDYRNLPEIQRCDSCQACASDEEAQTKFLRAVAAGVEKLPDQLIIFGANRKWET